MHSQKRPVPVFTYPAIPTQCRILLAFINILRTPVATETSLAGACEAVGEGDALAAVAARGRDTVVLYLAVQTWPGRYIGQGNP